MKNLKIADPSKVLIFLFLGTHFACFSQQDPKATYSADRDDPRVAEVDSAVEMAFVLRDSLQDSSRSPAWSHARFALKLAEEIDYDKGEGDAWTRIGLLYGRDNNPDSSRYAYKRGLAIRKEIGDVKGAAQISFGLSNNYRKGGYLQSAFEYGFESVVLADSSGDDATTVKALNALGNAYYELDDLSASEDQFRKALQLLAGLDEPWEKAKVMNNFGNTLLAQHKYQSALAYYDTSTSWYAAQGAEWLRADGLSNQGLVLTEQGNWTQSRELFLLALATYDSVGDLKAVAQTQLNLGAMFLDKEDWEQAGKWLLQVDTSYLDLPLFEEYWYNRYAMAKGLGQLDAALHYYLLQDSIGDVLLNEATARATADMRERYGSVLKDRQIERQKERLTQEENAFRMVMIGLIGALGLLLSAVVALWFTRKLRQQERELRQQEQEIHEQERVNHEQEKALHEQEREIHAREKEINLQKQKELMQEIEVKSLNAMLKGQEQERERIANDLHDRLGGLLSTIKVYFSAMEVKIETRERYLKANQLLDDAVAEVRKIAHDMVSGVLASFGLTAALDDLVRTISETKQLEISLVHHGMEERVSGEMELALFRIVQELWTNATRHAGATSFSIMLQRDKDRLSLIVEDNGSGFDPENVKKGVGLAGMEQRAHQIGGTLSIDSQLGHGTTTIVEVPLLKGDSDNESKNLP